MTTDLLITGTTCLVFGFVIGVYATAKFFWKKFDRVRKDYEQLIHDMDIENDY